ncbi:hypothetical protein STANM309S_04972 [Streptomyces tanashiensis]
MAGTPDICPALRYEDAKAAIRQLTEGFGFTEHAVYEGEDGRVMHAELTCGNGMVMLGSKGSGTAFDKLMADGGPTAVYVRVDDVDEEDRARRASGSETARSTVAVRARAAEGSADGVAGAGVRGVVGRAARWPVGAASLRGPAESRTRPPIRSRHARPAAARRAIGARVPPAVPGRRFRAARRTA